MVIFNLETNKTNDPFLALCLKTFCYFQLIMTWTKNQQADELSLIYSESPVDPRSLTDIRDNYKWEIILITFTFVITRVHQFTIQLAQRALRHIGSAHRPSTRANIEPTSGFIFPLLFTWAFLQR